MVNTEDTKDETKPLVASTASGSTAGGASGGDDSGSTTSSTDYYDWDEDTGEYEVENQLASRPVRRVNNSQISDLATEKGFEFETGDEATEAEKQELDPSAGNYWTREQMMKHLETCPKPEANPEMGDDCDIYDERIKYMKEVVKDGVYKRFMRRGAGAAVMENQAVLYNLNAFLEGQDEPFDSTWLRGRPNLHRLNYDTVLPGVCRALLTMRRGERSEFVVRPHLAYLEMGCPPRIPENATILYIIEVIRVFEEGTLSALDAMTFDERSQVPFETIVGLCDDERKSANAYFKAERFREAAFRYRRAIRVLEDLTFASEEENRRSNELLLKLYVNIGNAYNKLSKPLSAIGNCKKALAIDPQCAKAVYQLGLAKMSNADYETAQRLLRQAHQMKPKDQAVSDALTRLDHMMNGERRAKEEMYRKMGSVFVSKK
ncbi:unnamed protein product [Medioppia subpectinata]|uniref:peptidylprolyl isomerase n=1 Tax=Medioppia subpectinata TaxID=1979941 RepID=A0A7R9KHW5_9ACAR|nr:unnamed protein product [Medioppia subpectinata]CAG2102448.1 unnamed protein product [Medioppia subpectinata]